MKFFKEFIETFQRNGLSNTEKNLRSIDANHARLLESDLESAIEQAQCMVFSPANHAPIDVEHLDDPSSLDIPFTTVSMEILGGPITSPAPDQSLPPFNIECILVRENAPKDYTLWALVNSIGHGHDKHVVLISHASGRALVGKLLERLRTEKVGTETVRERVRLGSGKTKRVHTIRRIIHIAPKQGESNSSYGTRKVDWTHRFAVRGHWRKHEGLGKNRDSEYCVQGFTWVSEHVRGSEDAPLISKVRMVD